MEQTTNIRLTFLAGGQAQKHITHNEALSILDAVVQLAVLDIDLTTPPASPQAGSRYIVAAGATGAGSGKSGSVAAWQNGDSKFYASTVGWLAWVADETKILVWVGSSWVEAQGRNLSNSLASFGVNTTATGANRLSVKSDVVLFSHDDVTPGSGSIQHKLNKAASAKTTSLLFQDAYSGRAEIDLTGDDDLHIKVSANGSSWIEALTFGRSNGAVRHPAATSFEVTRTAGDVQSVTTLVCNNVITNVGGGYNGQTGHFVAPTAGRYLFCLFGLATNGGTAELQIHVNGVNRTSGRQYATAYGTTVQAFGLFMLNAGDDVAVIVMQCSFYGSAFTSFMGTYLEHIRISMNVNGGAKLCHVAA